MKIISASVKVIDERNHVLFLNENDVEIKLKDPPVSPIKEIPEIHEETPAPKKKAAKRKPAKK